MPLSSVKPAAQLSNVLKIALRGQSLLTSPRLNKGTAFSVTERKAFGLDGRLPYRVNTLDEQCQRAYEQLQTRETPIAKNLFLTSLKAQNWTLYYSLLSKHVKELVPIIYTPTEADAIASYSHQFRRSEGLYLSFPNRDTMEQDFLDQIRGGDIDLLVCTDSEAILGIGDQGVGGVGISTAKAALYSLIGGLDPAKTLSIVLDVGTNNEDLLKDPLYIGWRNKRIEGKEYDIFIDKFVQLVRKHLPNTLLHFEDFGVKNARRILERYHDTHAVFNDDIQGTGAISLACVMAGIGVSRRSRAAVKSPTGTSVTNDRLSDQRYVVFGAGSAGLGIATRLRDAMVAADGISVEEANKRFWMIDRDGLLVAKENPKESDPARAHFYRKEEEGWKAGKTGLLEVIKQAQPTVLVGCSTSAGAFDEKVIKAMSNGLEEGARPIILPLSNPSRLCEAKPEDLLKWTNGQALVATGSPFPRVEMEYKGRTIGYDIAECNNALIYPGLGFGAVLSKSRCMTDTMLLAGAKKLASLSPAILADNSKDDLSDYEYKGESLMPDFANAPKVNFEIAVAVAGQAIQEGSARAEWAQDLKAKGREEVEKIVREKAGEKVWVPVYYEYEYDKKGLEDI
ncbi:hypothetical protein CPB83DRAFT_863423 [Crepidotus variabilis]|uniref:Malic enzyme n=1 Tax=Crepidotus variabilis TaxID=179855 RepID=A0A9P6E5V6_9AGAR|nr:hypothetical protein CPB83DRAFT_863423 [Crepidotus variabilis]